MRLSPQKPGQRALVIFGLVYCYIVCLSTAMNNIFQLLWHVCAESVVKHQPTFR